MCMITRGLDTIEKCCLGCFDLKINLEASGNILINAGGFDDLNVGPRKSTYKSLTLNPANTLNYTLNVNTLDLTEDLSY